MQIAPSKEDVDYQISYAQNFEDVHLAAFFSDVDKGFYVDLGANDPVVHSVTKRFSLAGWRGINIEPIEDRYRALILDRPVDINLPIGISNAPGTLKFRKYVGEGLSTFSPAMMAQYAEQVSDSTESYRELEVEVRTLRDVLAEHTQGPIHFMKIDIEGFEYEALEGNDWTRFRPEVLCIEANHIVRDWHDLLREAGYSLAFFDGLNEYFVAAEAAHRTEQFRLSFVDVAVTGPPILPYPVHIEWRQRDDDLLRLEAELTAARLRAGALKTELRRAKKRLVNLGTREVVEDPLVRILDARLSARLKHWQRSSKQARRRRLEHLSLRAAGGTPDQLLARVREVDRRVLTVGVQPSSVSVAAWKGYRLAKRVSRKPIALVRGRGMPKKGLVG